MWFCRGICFNKCFLRYVEHRKSWGALTWIESSHNDSAEVESGSHNRPVTTGFWMHWGYVVDFLGKTHLIVSRIYNVSSLQNHIAGLITKKRRWTILHHAFLVHEFFTHSCWRYLRLVLSFYRNLLPVTMFIITLLWPEKLNWTLEAIKRHFGSWCLYRFDIGLSFSSRWFQSPSYKIPRTTRLGQRGRGWQWMTMVRFW